MSRLPTFFFSHARQDRETSGNYVDKFFEDLEGRIAQFDAIDLERNTLGTIDREVRQGADWDTELSGPLRNNKSFVALLTPLYFTRENCGKELYAFLIRSKNLGIDANGALTNVENVLPIRWLREEAYSQNTQKDERIPLFLRRINDTPGDKSKDEERTEAIRRYRKKGMSRCVDVPPHYDELLDLFALTIRELADLPPAGDISFAKLENAFEYDWNKHFVDKPGPIPAAPPPIEHLYPEPLTSVVAFYLTKRKYVPDTHAVDFAARLISDKPSEPGSDKGFQALLSDVRSAAVAENLTIFHAAAEPSVSKDPQTLLQRVLKLSNQHVLTILIVDSNLWPGGDTAFVTDVDRVVSSPECIGHLFITDAPHHGAVDQLAKLRNLPSRISGLPSDSAERTDSLRRTLVELRGLQLRAIKDVPGSSRLPLIANSTKTGTGRG
jgi:hypothetical protein